MPAAFLAAAFFTAGSGARFRTAALFALVFGFAAGACLACSRCFRNAAQRFLWAAAMTTTANHVMDAKQIRRPEGAACNHPLATAVEGHASVYRCARCEAVYGNCYLGDSYSLVLPAMAASEPLEDRLRYFDLECLGSQGITRRHGWYDTETRRIVQVG